ncbi:MAG: hypothetical protein ABIQ09_07870 [Jatrophihabitantaceae bacterium]
MSDFSALQVESPTSRAVADLPGANWILLMGLPLRAAGLPSVAPALISWTPGNPVSEQVLVELLVNCRKAYWCPAAPEARSAATPSDALGQPFGPSIGPAGVELAGARDGLEGTGLTEEGAAVGRVELAAAVALQLAELVGADADVGVDKALLATADEAAGWSAAVEDAGVQAAVNAREVSSSGSASRRTPQR